MKLTFFTLFAVIAVLLPQEFCDAESEKDDVDGRIPELHGKFSRRRRELEGKVNKFEKNENQILSEFEPAEGKLLKDALSPVRARRSPQTFPDSQKDPVQEASEKIKDTFDELKESVANASNTVANSDIFTGISNQFGKFKQSLSETGDKIKSKIHEYTAPSDDKKESTESH